MGKTETRTGVCGLCGGECIICAEMKDGKIESVRKGSHPVLKNSICVKGTALKQYIYHKDRLTEPLKLVGEKGSGKYVPISWDEALDTLAKRLLLTKEESGSEKTVFYVGHPKWARRAVADLAAAYGTPNFCTESSSCNSALSIAWKLTAGFERPEADAVNSDTFVIWTQNTAGADGSLNKILKIKERGIKTIVVDPRITPVAARADLHLQPFPGTDGALALAIANVIISCGLENRDFIEKYTYGFEEFKQYVREFTPERGEEITGVPKEKIEEAALMIGRGKTAIDCSSCSVFHNPNGVQNFRAVTCLSILTGSCGVEGGNRPLSYKDRVIIDANPHNLAERPGIDKDITAGKYPIWNELIGNEAQAAHLADIILNEEPYKIRNLVAFSMNSHIFPRPDKMKEALKKVEFVAVAELFWNEACEMADIVLPAAAPAERDYVYAGKGNKMVFLPPLANPENKRNDVDIVIDLGHRMGLEGEIISLENYDAYLNYLIRKTGVTLDELKASPEGVTAKKVIPGHPFNPEEGYDTPTGKAEFMSARMAKYDTLPGYDALPVFHDWRDSRKDAEEYPFTLVAGPRKAFYWHSRTYRMKWISDLEKHTLLSISAADAEKMNIKDGDRVRITTPVRSMEYGAYIDSGLLPGVVYLFHGDGEQDANYLVDDTINDPVSGFPIYRSNVCNIEKL